MDREWNCNRVELKMKEEAETQSTSSDFSSMSDGFGYQQPSRDPKVPSPANIDMTLLEQIQAFLSASAEQGFKPSRKEPAHYMDNVSRQPPRYGGNPGVICHSCGQLGHYRPQCPNNNKGATSNPIREQARFGERQDGRSETRNRGQQNPSPYQRHNRESGALT